MTDINIDTIILELEGAVKAGYPVSAIDYIEKAVRLNILLSDESAKLFDLQQKIAEIRVAFLDEGTSGKEADIRVQALETYKEMLIQKAKIDRVIEFVRLAKHRSRLAQEEFRGNA